MAIVTEKPDFEQEPLIEAAYIKFSGRSTGTLDDPPALDEGRTYIVKATCSSRNFVTRADGEHCLNVTMSIDSIYERGKQPIVDEAHPSLYDALEGREEHALDSDGEEVGDGEEVDPDEDRADDEQPEAAEAATGIVEQSEATVHSFPAFTSAD